MLAEAQHQRHPGAGQSHRPFQVSPANGAEETSWIAASHRSGAGTQGVKCDMLLRLCSRSTGCRHFGPSAGVA
uniref:Uncharacterized protein n=1 Tax=Arundo donax TaxID=35708 RepID=A0A0A9D8G2_ARUDO